MYKAEHVLMKRLVTLKILGRADVSAGAEIVTVAGLCHPHLVAAHHATRLRGRLVLVLEYVDGVDLEYLLNEIGPLPIELARAELREETGLSAGRLTHLGRWFTAPGFCTQSCDVYLAEELAAGPTEREVTEQDMTHRLVPLAQFRELAARGAITDSATLAAYALLVLAEHP